MLGFVRFLAMNAMLLSGATDDLPAAEEVEKKVIEYRQALKTAEVKLSQSSYSKESGPPDEEQRTRIWFDGKKIRNDIERRASADQPFYREIHGRHCEREGYLLFYTEEKPPPGVAYGLEFHQLGPSTDPLSFPVIDPRLLGLAICPSHRLPQSHFEEFLRPPNRHPPGIRKTTLNGKDLLLVEYTYLQGTRVRMWIAPDRGPSIVRMESEYVVDGKQGLHSLVCDLAESPGGGYWFPKSCTYQYTIDGKLQYKEVAQVEIVSLNELLPSGAFTLAGMGIAKDTVITGLPRVDKADGPPFWNGDTVLTPKNTSPPFTPPAVSSGWRRPLLLGGSIVLALLAGVLVWHILLRKKPA